MGLEIEQRTERRENSGNILRPCNGRLVPAVAFYTEEIVKVVTSVWGGGEFIKFLAVLTVLHLTIQILG